MTSEDASESWNKWAKDIVPCGLPNTGCSCYLNAALQFMFAVKPLHHALTQNAVSHDAESLAGNIVALAREMACLDRVDGVEYDTASHFRRVAAAGDLKFDDGSQQDSLEYFLHLLRQIEEHMPDMCKNSCNLLKVQLCEKIERGSDVNYVFRDEYVLSCPVETKGNDTEENKDNNIGGIHNKRKQEHDVDDSPPQEKKTKGIVEDAMTAINTNDDHTDEIIKSNSDETQEKTRYEHDESSEEKEPHRKNAKVIDCINKFMAREQILTSGPQKVFKTSRISSLPAYFVIQPRTFIINQCGASEKLDVALDVPDELCLNSHMCSDEWLNHMPNKDPAINRESTNYKLKAFVSHYGPTTATGCYVCHVKHCDVWYYCFDKNIHSVENENIPKEDGYFFLYERIDVDK